MTWNASTFVTYQEKNHESENKRFKQKEILLDNQADVSVMHPSLLHDNIQSTEQEVKINGVAGHQLFFSSICEREYPGKHTESL